MLATTTARTAPHAAGSSSARRPFTAARPMQRRLSTATAAASASASSSSSSSSSSWHVLAASALAATTLLLSSTGPAWAGRDKVGEFQASGFLFKDTVEVTALDDPEVPGVTIYISDFKRSLVDKLQKDFFSEPSQASLSCSISPEAAITNVAALGGAEGKEVLSEKKGLSIFKDKTLRVRRLYDSSRDTLVYVAYSTRLSSAADEGAVSTGRYRTSLCALKVPSAGREAAAVVQ